MGLKNSISVIAFLFVLSMGLHAQNNFEGKISFGLELEGDRAAELKSFMPSAYEYIFSASKFRLNTKGGMTSQMMGDFLVDFATGESFMINHGSMIAYRLPKDEETSQGAEQVVSAMDEVETILGHVCKKYKVTSQDEKGAETVQYLWVAEDIHIQHKPKHLKGGVSIFADGINGFPLKIEFSMMGLTCITTATEINTGPVNNKELVVPAEYSIDKFSNSYLGGPAR